MDVSEKFTALAREAWKKAGVEKKVTLSLDGGIAVLKKLVADERELATYDFAYVDAVKEEYAECVDYTLKLLRVGGVLVVDNTLWKYRVCAPPSTSDMKSTKAVRKFNLKVKNDQSIDVVLCDIGDGATFIRKLR